MNAQNKQSVVDSDKQPEIRVSEMQTKKSGVHRNIIFVLIVIFVIALVCTLLYRGKPDTSPVDTSNVIEVDTTAAMKDLQSSYEKSSSITLTDLQSKPITVTTFKSTKDAYNGAVLLFAAGNYDQSLQAFAVAESKGGDVITYQFYLDYTAAADAAKQPDLALQLLQKSYNTVTQDKSLTAEEQTEQQQSIQSEINSRKAGM